MNMSEGNTANTFMDYKAVCNIHSMFQDDALRLYEVPVSNLLPVAYLMSMCVSHDKRTGVVHLDLQLHRLPQFR